MKSFVWKLGLPGAAISSALVIAIAAGPAFGDDVIEEEPYTYEGGEVGPEIDADAPAPPTASSKEAELLAEIHGISTDEAFQIALWMGEAETALQKVRSAYPDTYAGGAFDHDNGSIRIDLWVTGDGKAEKTLFDSSLPMAGFASSDVKEAPLSEIELVTSFVSAAQDSPELFGAQSIDDIAGGLDFKTGRFIPADPALLSTGNEDGHDRCIHGTGGWLEAGRLLKLDSSQLRYYDKSDGCTFSSSPCTSGFTSYANGKQGVLTAGHCLSSFSIGDKGVGEMYADGKELFVPLRVYDVDTWFDDIGFAREVYASADPRGRIWLSPTDGWRDITELLPAAAPDWSVRCIKSAGWNDIGDPPVHEDGFKCGTVQPGNGNWCEVLVCKYTRVDNSAWNDFPEGGSSGGPWFYLGKAAGIHKRSYTDAGVYYRLEHAKQAISGLSIYCGGVNEFLCSWP